LCGTQKKVKSFKDDRNNQHNIINHVSWQEGWQHKLNDLSKKHKLNEQRSLELFSETPEISEYCSAPEETEKSLQTTKLHSRSQSLSSSEIFQLLSLNVSISSQQAS
jgi:hypothetical protein